MCFNTPADPCPSSFLSSSSSSSTSYFSLLPLLLRLLLLFALHLHLLHTCTSTIIIPCPSLPPPIPPLHPFPSYSPLVTFFYYIHSTPIHYITSILSYLITYTILRSITSSFLMLSYQSYHTPPPPTLPLHHTPLHRLKGELKIKIIEIEEVRRSSGTEVTALQATVRQLQGDVDDSSRRHSELQLVEVLYNHSLCNYSLSLSVCL